MSANSNANGIFNSTVTVTAASTLRASQFQGQGVGAELRRQYPGRLGQPHHRRQHHRQCHRHGDAGHASGYTGTITIGANAALGIGSGSRISSAPTPSPFRHNATSGIGLVADGDGTSTPEQLAFVLPSNITINFGAANTTGYIVGRAGATTQFNQAANKRST